MESYGLNFEQPSFYPYTSNIDDIWGHTDFGLSDHGASTSQPYAIDWQTILNGNPVQLLPNDAPDDAILMLPTKKRKRKAPTLRTDDFEPYKARILELHIDQDIPLPSVKAIIENESPFKAEYVSSRLQVPYCTNRRISIEFDSIEAKSRNGRRTKTSKS
jgi:hypothetical protein